MDTDVMDSVALLLRSSTPGSQGFLSLVVDETRTEMDTWGVPFLAINMQGACNIECSNELVMAPPEFFRVRDALLMARAYASGTVNVDPRRIPSEFRVFGMSVKRERIHERPLSFRANGRTWNVWICEASTRDSCHDDFMQFIPLDDFARYGKVMMTVVSYRIWTHFVGLQAARVEPTTKKVQDGSHREGRRQPAWQALMAH